MRFIDHNKAKISEWGKKGGAGPITTNGFWAVGASFS